MRQFYLQLHFDVIFDPSFRQMRATWRNAFIDILCYAVKSTEPGIIDYPLEILARMMGFHKFANFDKMLQEFENRRLIAFRKDDEAIVVNPNLLPQLGQYAAEEFPRRRKPSEESEATRARKELSRQKAKQLILPQTKGENRQPKAENVTPQNAMSHPQVVTPNNIIEQNIKEQNTTTTPSGTVESVTNGVADDVVVAPAARLKTEEILCLIDEGVTEKVADDLVEKYGVTACIVQREYLPYRQDIKEPGAALVKAISERWAAPAGYKEAKKREEAERKKVDQARQAQAAAEQKLKRDELIAQEVESLRKSLTTKDTHELHAQALASLPEKIQIEYRINGEKQLWMRESLKAARETIIRSRAEAAIAGREGT